MSYSDAIYFTADGNGNPSRAILVRKSVVAVDGFEDPPEVVREGAGGGDRLPSGLELGCAVAAGVLASFLTGQPVWASIQRLTARRGLRFQLRW
jgi:hypothetical protein